MRIDLDNKYIIIYLIENLGKLEYIKVDILQGNIDFKVIKIKNVIKSLETKQFQTKLNQAGIFSLNTPVHARTIMLEVRTHLYFVKFKQKY